jgi:hypothetical protein
MLDPEARLVVIWRRLTLTLFATLALLVTSNAHAHMGSVKAIDATLVDDGVRLMVQVDAVDAALAVGVGASATPDELRAREALVRGWLLRGLSVRRGASVCSRTPGLLDFARRDGRSSLLVGFDYSCPSGSESLQLRDDTVFGEDPAHQTIVTVRSGDAAVTRILRADQREASLEVAPPALQTGLHFLREGAVHLVTGYDHLLFLLSLLLAAGGMAARFGSRRALRDATLVVTAFTLGHSVTLSAAVLGVVVLPSKLVETAIAASIVIVAALNLVRPDTGIGRPVLAFVFGLIHGFGFSSVLSELGLPAGQRVLALASFNVGIELAQLAVVIALMPLIVWLLSHETKRVWLMRGASTLIAACGCFWFAERAFG